MWNLIWNIVLFQEFLSTAVLSLVAHFLESWIFKHDRLMLWSWLGALPIKQVFIIPSILWTLNNPKLMFLQLFTNSKPCLLLLSSISLAFPVGPFLQIEIICLLFFYPCVTAVLYTYCFQKEWTRLCCTTFWLPVLLKHSSASIEW